MSFLCYRMGSCIPALLLQIQKQFCVHCPAHGTHWGNGRTGAALPQLTLEPTAGQLPSCTSVSYLAREVVALLLCEMGGWDHVLRMGSCPCLSKERKSVGKEVRSPLVSQESHGLCSGAAREQRGVCRIPAPCQLSLRCPHEGRGRLA